MILALAARRPSRAAINIQTIQIVSHAPTAPNVYSTSMFLWMIGNSGSIHRPPRDDG
jgi:hypothetical protein